MQQVYNFCGFVESAKAAATTINLLWVNCSWAFSHRILILLPATVAEVPTAIFIYIFYKQKMKSFSRKLKRKCLSIAKCPK